MPREHRERKLDILRPHYTSKVYSMTSPRHADNVVFMKLSEEKGEQ